MIKKIKSSLVLKTFISMVLLFIMCCMIMYGVIIYFLPKTYRSELEIQFTQNFQQLTDNLAIQNMREIKASVAKFSMENNASIKILDENGKCILSVNTNLKQNVASKEVQTYTAFSVVKNGDENMMVYATVSFAEVRKSYEILIKLLPIILGIVVIISLFISLICSQVYTKPLIKICRVAKRMARLDMTWRCETKRTDEVGTLAESLNELSSQLSDTLSELQEANEQLKHDIIKEHKQEEERVAFFMAVSHELKTPITIIKGEIEGMIYKVGPYKDRDAYLVHTLKMTETMQKLIQEILYVAKIERNEFGLKLSDIQLSREVKECCESVMIMGKQKNIILETQIEESNLYRGDLNMIRKVISNVIGNAFSHSPEGSSIKVSLKRNIFTVINTNAYIDEEELEQIFLPFYRIDKSRNHNTGGSGLGLFIVHKILKKHEIQYKIQNTEEGVCFTINFISR